MSLNLSEIDFKYLDFNIKPFISNGYKYYRIQKQLDKNNKINITAKTKNLVKQKYFEKLEKYLKNLNGNIDLEDINFSDFVKYYLFEIVLPSNSIKQKTFSCYESFYRIHIKDSIFNNIKLNQLKKEHFQKFFNNLQEKNLKLSTIKQIKIFINIVLNYAIEEEYINKNFCKNIKLPKDMDIKNNKYLSDDEINIIFKKCKDEKLLIIIKIALSTGMRINEILALTEKDFNFEKYYINVDKIISSSKQFIDENNYKNEIIITPPKSKNSIRKAYFNKNISEDIKKYILSEKERYLKNGKSYTTETLIFTNKYFNPYNFYSLNIKVNKLFKDCNINARSFHIFRHTSGSKLYESGVNIKTISEQLGHANTNITSNIYVHLNENLKKEAIENLDIYFKKIN